MPRRIDRDIIEAAISGYESKVAAFQKRIDELRSMLDGAPGARPERTAPAAEATIRTKSGAKRRMSAAAKRKLSRAAKLRWAQLKRRHPNAKTLAG